MPTEAAARERENQETVAVVEKDLALTLADTGTLEPVKVHELSIPELDGEAAITMIAAEGATVKKGETIDKVLGLKLGADDYLTKPFEMIELLARVEVLLRRSQERPSHPNGEFRFGNIGVDFKRAEVTKDSSPLELSAMEFRLLQFFIENRGLVHSRDDLLDAVWGYDAMPTTRTVDVHIAWLRQKLEENPRHPQFIQTVHGMGYKFVV